MTTSLWPFQSPANHEAVSGILRRRSSNHVDLTRAAIANLDLAGAKSVLDLGCGFGLMSEAIARLTAPDAHLLGVDLWAENGQSFLSRVAATGRRGTFVCKEVGSDLNLGDASFDLIVCSFSLYYFVDALASIACMLKPNGLFVAITHSREAFVNPLRVVGVETAGSELSTLAQRFCAENGDQVLSGSFSQITKLDYVNTLTFEPPHLDDLLTYLSFKHPFLVEGAAAGDALPESMQQAVRTAMARDGRIVLDKTDAVFRCRGPVCQPS